MAVTSPELVRFSKPGWIAALAVAFGLTGCGGDGGGGTGTPPSSSKDTTAVAVDGSSTVFRISRTAHEEFSKVDDTEVVVNNSGTSGGFSKYLQNEVDIVGASRPAKADEETKANAQGMPWVRFLVGYDGITLVINPKNDFVKELTVEQLKKLWEPDSQVKTWRDLDPSWPAREIKLYSPDDKSGTFEFFTEAIVGKAKSQRKDVQPSSDDNTLVRGVAGDPDGIGYFGYAYYKANVSDLKAVSIKKDKDAPAVAPSPETILDKTYAPLSRPLFIYVKKSAYKRAGVAAFVKFYLEHVAELATKAKYVSPTEDDLKANKATLEKLGGVEATAG
jgi:phosphate transport system substrate-binding protein